MNNTQYAVNLATLLVERYSLCPPVKIEEVAARFATVEKVEMPQNLNVDGACIGLKTKSPTIIANTRGRSEVRIRFTIAHELGHLLLPWHVGDFLDKSLDSYEIGMYEREANLFAAEILAPTKWAKCFFAEQDTDHDELLTQIRKFATAAEVSKYTAFFRFISVANPGYLFAFIDNDGKVTRQGKSPGTSASLPKLIKFPQQVVFENLASELCMDAHWDDKRVCVWRVDSELKLVDPTTGMTWKELRDYIIDDVFPMESRRTLLRSSMSGVIAAANGQYKGSSLEALNSVIWQRLANKARERPEYKRFIEHPLAKEMVSKWIQDHRPCL